MMSQGRLSARAVCRLRIAAALMRVNVGGDPTQAQCEQLLRRIDALSAEARERLRERVNWVEAYERAESEAVNGFLRGPVIHRNGGQGSGEAADDVSA